MPPHHEAQYEQRRKCSSSLNEPLESAGSASTSEYHEKVTFSQLSGVATRYRGDRARNLGHSVESVGCLTEPAVFARPVRCRPSVDSVGHTDSRATGRHQRRRRRPRRSGHLSIGYAVRRLPRASPPLSGRVAPVGSLEGSRTRRAGRASAVQSDDRHPFDAGQVHCHLGRLSLKAHPASESC